jgi:arylsulfatase A-like enzyme
VYHSPKDNREGWSEAPWVVEAGHASSFDPESQRERSPTGRGRIYEHPDVPDNAYADGKIAEKTIQDLRRFKQSGQPFLLFCGFIRPHMPFYAPKKYWDLYDRKDIIVAENRSRPENTPAALQGSAEFKQYHLGEYQPNTDAFHRMMRHGYLASVSYTDKLVGDVLTALEDLGLAQNTIVVLWGDHGWNLGEHDFWGKHNTMHTALRVPLIVRAPGLEKGVSKALVASVDIFPTLCALAKVEAPSTVQGRSFVNLLEKPDRKFRDMIYSRFRAGDTALTERFSYTSYGKNGEMLYDLLKDPVENHNVVASPEYRGDYERMKQLLAGAMQEAAQAKLPVAAK